RFATADLSGRQVSGVFARGKHLLARIEGGVTLHSHLRMDGEWRLFPAQGRAGPPGHGGTGGSGSDHPGGGAGAGRGDGSGHRGRPGGWGGPGGRDAHRVRAVLANDEWAAVGYRVHDLALVATAREDALVGHLGPDLLGPDWDPDEAVRRLAARPDR